MHEIKFRAWDAEKKEWLHNGLFAVIGYAVGAILISENGQWRERYTKIELSQFTGLKDKNGKEIYEGDILQRGDGEYGGTWRVLYSKGGFGAKEERPDLGRDKVSNYYGLDCGIFHDNTWEIIGNQYENPDFLLSYEEN